MNILVTGAAGFIGQHLCRELHGHGHTVVRADLRDGVNLRSPHLTDRFFNRHPDLDVCVHLAARVGRMFGEDDLTDTIVDNAAMTAVVAKACGTRGVRLLYASTSEIYGDNGDVTCDEQDGPFRLPHNLYGLSKGWGEHVAELYAPQGLTILRFSMPYGPGLPAGRGRAAIINMLHQALHRQQIPVHHGAERSWCWIGDTVRAVRLTIERSEGGVFNVGRDDDPVPMLQVAQIACRLTGAPENLIREAPAPSNQTVVKRLATHRVRELGWQPAVDLEAGMRLTLAWVLTLDADGNPPGHTVVKSPAAATGRRRRV